MGGGGVCVGVDVSPRVRGYVVSCTKQCLKSGGNPRTDFYHVQGSVGGAIWSDVCQ